jgi:uncharacterized membrane protein
VVRERDERGATAVLTAVVVSLVLFAVGAIVIDIGTQRSARRDMQAVADVVALDLARELDGRTASAILGASPSLQTLANQSAARNSDAIGDAVDVSPTLGTLTPGGAFVAVGGGDVPNAVRVTAHTDVDFGIASGIAGLPGNGAANRAAVATADESACFSIGSYAARLDSSSSVLLDGILEGILGGGVNLDVLSYTGIANANVSLLDIALDLGLGSVEELLSSNVTAGQLLIAAAHVLSADGVANANILSLVGASIGSLSFDIGDLISAESGTSAAETVTINALDLLAGTVLIANGTNALSIPALATNLPISGTGLTTSLSLIEKARTRCGKRGSQADTAQVAASISGNILSGQSALGLPLTGTTTIAVNVASARGTLTDIICGAETGADPSGLDVQVTSGAVSASAELGLTVNASTNNSANVGGLIGGITSLLSLLGLNKIASIEVHGSIGLKVATGDPSTVRTAEIRVPNDAWNEGKSTGSGDLGLGTSTVTTTSNTLTITAKNFLGLNVSLNATQIAGIVGNLVSSVTSSLLNPLVTAINDNLLHPLYDILGLSVGGADVYGQRPSCSDPSLVG